MPVLDKAIDKLIALYPMVDTPTGGASTTIATSDITKGATTVTVASGTNIANGDDLRIGTGETMELVRVASGGGTTSIVLAKGTKYAHVVGEAVVEQSALSIGTPEADGFRLSISGETSDVFAATQALAYGALNGFVDVFASWRYPVITVDVLAFALGIPRSAIIGSGTAAVQTGTTGPRLFTTDGALFGTATNYNAVAVVQRKDGTYATVYLYNMSFDPTVVNTVFGRGQLSTVPVRVMASHAAVDFTNSLFTPANTITTFASAKTDIFSEITVAATLEDTGTPTTTTAGVAAGAYSIPVTSASAAGIAAGSWIRLDTGDQVEYHLVDNVATNTTLNLRTQVFRAHNSGVAVSATTVTDLGGLNGGFTFAMQGSTITQRAETFRTSLGLKTGNVAAAFNFNVLSYTPEAVSLQLGIPASATVANVLPLGAAIATANPKTVLLRGLTQGGKTVTICGWYGSSVVGGETVFTQASQGVVPVSIKPAALQVFVNA